MYSCFEFKGFEGKTILRCLVKEVSKKQAKMQYNPNLGFIGNAEVKVSNYLFSAKKLQKAYHHAKPVADRILSKEVSTHFNESKKLTKFLKNRDLTFSKKTNNGKYKEFVVPCTTTLVPLQKSLFNEVEEASQRLIIALRKVLQDIYGSKNLKASKFINSLPKEIKTVFLEVIQTSASYYPQLHHPNMKDYPFFDNVGLDLVLVEDYLQQTDSFPKLIAKNKQDELPGLPFRILELNAGSPSGASNNMNMLEGIYKQNPDILENLGKVMPNDHFKVLGETYKSLGEYWTKKTDAVQILLPPGGQNGAAPEIHQLAAYSGLIYADPDQLYLDSKGYIRLRTVGKNPIVSAIYSRVNSDSALFDPKKGLILRDPDTGKPIYLTDGLRLDKNGEAMVITDVNGKPLPLQSSYAIPGAINAIVNRKLYLGGLNRILDNKIILATLTHYAPKYYASEIAKMGINPSGTKIMPPQTLPPNAESVKIIEHNPDEWVVKAPSLAGGEGVYILKTLSISKKNEVLDMIRKKPKDFAYQQLVKIGRIPVAVKRKDQGYRFANLAADIRLWVFYGAGKNALPKLTHNALVRYAPQEKGKMSSIVNTSAGGGYAPFVIVDDINEKNSVTAKELTAPLKPNIFQTKFPVFVAAQMVQVSKLLQESNKLLTKDSTCAYELLGTMISLKLQLREILSFLHPRAIESIYKIIDLLESKFSKSEVSAYYKLINDNQITIVQILKKIEKHLPLSFFDTLDNIRVLNIDLVNSNYSNEDRALDLVQIAELKAIAGEVKMISPKIAKLVKRLLATLKSSVIASRPNTVLSIRCRKTITTLLEDFCKKCVSRVEKSKETKEFTPLFEIKSKVPTFQFETLYLAKKDKDKEIRVASQFEIKTGKKLTDSEFIAPHIQEARQAWLKIQASSLSLNDADKQVYLTEKRAKHFKKFPFLMRYQSLINKENLSINELIELLPIVPYAKFNIEQFAREKGLRIKDIFSKQLQSDRISVLSSAELKKLKLCTRNHAGECFAKKKKSHGLFSDSDIFIWLRAELDPFTLLYTAGHELIHYQQLKNSMNNEKNAIKDGGLSAAKFLNYYGNFLGANKRTLDSINFNMQQERRPLYGYVDRYIKDVNRPIIRELRKALATSDQAWSDTLDIYGSLYGYMMPTSCATKVKALQEVLPALENAKNILFAKELGLEIFIDPISSALPVANEEQRNRYGSMILLAASNPEINWEALRIIASHQYHGIIFNRSDREENNLTLTPLTSAISMGQSYNQTQQ